MLTKQGEAESRSVALGLKESGIQIDWAFSSMFQRTIRSAEIILQGLGSSAPLHPDPALNERDYGDLTGLNKDQAIEHWGASTVAQWRRSYAIPPPGGESLRDVVARVAPYYLRCVLPRVLRGGTVLVVGHGNTLRALVTALEGLSPEAVCRLEIATGERVEYDVASDSRVVRKSAISV